MARTPTPRRTRTPRAASPTSLSRGVAGALARRLAAGVLGVAAALAALPGCVGGGGALSGGDALTPQADCARRSVPMPAAVPREFHKTLLPTYRFAPGDTVLVESADFDANLKFPADQTVQPDGTIDLGRFGRPAIAGMSVAEVEALVDRRVDTVLSNDERFLNQYPDESYADIRESGLLEINVRLIDPAGSVYYVLGAVAAPGVYPLAGRETVLDAILTAGGLADNAKKCDVILSRPSVPHDCRTVLPVCYNHVVQSGDSTTNYQILPGDRIFVPSKGCKDTIAEALGCDKGCDLCACHPQFPCGPDSKPCPTPVRYEAFCPDPAGVTSLGELDGLPPRFPDAIPAPAPLPRGDGGTNAGDEGDDDAVDPAPAPPEMTDEMDDAPVDDAPATDDGNGDVPESAPAPPDVPEIPDLPNLDDLAADAVPALPTLDSDGV